MASALAGDQTDDLDGDLDSDVVSPVAAVALRRQIPSTLAGLRADLALGSLFPEFSRSRIQSWMRAGLVSVDGRSLTLREKVWPGGWVTLPEPPDVDGMAVLPQAVPLKVIFEDQTLLVLHKPAGLVVHPGNGNPGGTIQNGLLYRDPALAKVPRAGIVHRLDKDTSGLMVVARTLEAHADLVRQLQARTVRRHYHALVHGGLSGPGTVDAPVGRHPSQRTRMAVVASGRPAITHYTPVAVHGPFTLVECRLETGRTHQIRVHMQHIGHPLVGDPVYAAGAPTQRQWPDAARRFARQALHAFRLGLIHPASGAELVWQIDLEADLAHLLEDLDAG